MPQSALHRFYRVNGVARRSFNCGGFNCRRYKARFMGARYRHHGKALNVVRQVVVNLMGRIAGGNKKYPVEVEAPLRRLRRRHVSGVDGIKGSAKNCNVHEKRKVESSSHRLIGQGCPLKSLNTMQVGSPNHSMSKGLDDSMARSSDFGIFSSSAQMASFNSSRPSPVTDEISCKGRPCCPQNSRKRTSRSPSPTASIREATRRVGFSATTGMKLRSSFRMMS